MKTRNRLALLSALALVAFVSCQPQEQTEPVKWRTDLQVVNDNLTFLPGGGTGTVEMNHSVTKATSNSPWVQASVSGSTVTVTVDEWKGNQARYATLSVADATESIDVAVIQYGEVIAGLDMSDISAPFEGTVVQYDVKLNVEMSMTADKSWIHPVYDPEERLVTITIDRNPQSATRTGVVSYNAGSVSGTIDVIQNPPYVRAEDWILTPGDAYYTYPDFFLPGTTVPAAGDMYYMVSIPASSVSGDIVDYIFSTVAGSVRREILDKAASTGQAFKDLLLTGEQTKDLNAIQGGNYLIAIGFAEDSYVTGKYQYVAVEVGDVRPAYFKWAGTWAVSSGDFNETWTISIDEENLLENLNVDGINSITTAAVVDNKASTMVLKYNPETGTIALQTQKGKEFKYSDSYGICTMQAQGRITTNGGSSYSRITSMGTTIFTCALSEDGKSATMTPAQVTVSAGTFPFVQMRLWLVRNDTGGTYSLNASTGLIPLPLQMVKMGD